MFFNEYPYTNFHELNLDMILSLMKKLNAEWDEFTAVNKITNAGAWDITKQYQAWTVVSDNNVGYISLKPVPAGVAITNTEYWGVIADYDILITDLSNRISTLEGQMAAVNNIEIPNIKNSINTINANIEPIINRKYVFLGDSYNYWGGGWLSAVTTALGIPGTNFYDYTVSAHGFTTINTWEEDITQFVVDHPDVAPDITDIVIVGGINDTTAAGVAALPTAVPSFCTYVSSHLPKAKITFCFVGNMRQTSTYWTTDKYKNKIKAMEIIRRFISLAGGSYNEGCMNAMYSYSFFDSDGVHPNNFGQYYGIIPAVVCALNNQDFDACFSFESGTEGNNNWIREDMLSGRDRLMIAGYQLANGTTITSSWQDIITLDAGIAGTNHTQVPCWVQIMNYNDAPKYFCYARVRDGKLQMKLADPLNDHAYPTVVANTLTFIKEIIFDDPIQNCV